MTIGIWSVCKSRFELRKYIIGFSLTSTMALSLGLLGTIVCIGAFDGLNRLFADRDVSTVRGVVKYGKYRQYLGRGQSKYVTIVELPEERRSMKIVDVKLFEMPPESNVEISYRKGLFGVEIIDNINYE